MQDTWLYHLIVASAGGHGTADAGSSAVSEYEQLVLNLMFVDGDSSSSYWNDASLMHTKELSLPRPLTTLRSDELQKKALDMYKACIFYAFVTRHCRWRHYVVRLSHRNVRSFGHSSISLSGQILLPWYLMNSLNSFDRTDREYSIAVADDLIRFWNSVVKGQGHSRPLRSNFVNTISRELFVQSRWNLRGIITSHYSLPDSILEVKSQSQGHTLVQVCGGEGVEVYL